MSEINHRKRILFVAYQFPPVGGVGVHRIVKLAKYLPQFGWDVSVLTVENPSVPLTDSSFENDIPAETMIRRARTWEPGYALKQGVSSSHSESRHLLQWPKSLIKASAKHVANTLLQPDLQILWKPEAVKVGCELLQEMPHDVVMATAPPFSSFLVGRELAGRFQLPLVLDYRDEWGISQSYWENKSSNWLTRSIQSRMQSRLLHAADLVLGTSPSTVEHLARLGAQARSSARFEMLCNGFDEDDFEQTGSATNRQDFGNGTNRFRMAYLGTLWNLNSAEPLVTAVEILQQRSPKLLNQLELVIAGRRTPQQESLLNRIEATNCQLIRLPFISHDEATRLMQTSDSLILLNANVPHAERIVNAKSFEYLAVERPFALISPPGDMWSLFEDCPFAFPVHPDRPQAIADFIADGIERNQLGLQIEAGSWKPDIHSRRERAKQFAEMLNECVPQRQAHNHEEVLQS